MSTLSSMLGGTFIGYSGISGFSGTSGESGASGISGYSGFSGISGYSGASGMSGFSGTSGYSGADMMQYPTAGIAVSTGTAWNTSKTAPTGDIVGTTDTQTLTNKTLTTPVISTIVNTGTLTLPTSTDTLVGRATTDTLTNKTLTSPTLTTPVLGTPSSGNLSNCTVDGTISIGYRNIPQSGTDKTTSYSLVKGDVGEFVSIGTGGSITVPASTFSAGDIIMIYNNTTGNITITCSAVTTYIGGINTVKTSVSLATRGICSVFFYSPSACIITGNVS